MIDYKDYKKTYLNELIAPQTNRFFVIGNFGNGNLGDELLLFSTLKQLSSANSVSVAVRSPEFIDPLNKAFINTTFVRPFSVAGLRKYFSSSVIVIGPGGLFGEDVGHFTALIPFLALSSKILGKKVIFYGIGAYEKCPKIIIKLLQLAIYFSDKSTCRDKHTFSLLKNSFFSNKIELILDVGFLGLEDLVKYKLHVQSSKAEDNEIILVIRHIDDKQKSGLFAKKLVAILNTLEETRQLKSRLVNFYNLPNTLKIQVDTPSDNQFLYAELELTSQKVRVDKHPTLIDVVNVIASSKLVIASRLHAQIIAAALNKPLIALGYSPKNEFLLEYDKALVMPYDTFIRAEDITLKLNEIL